MRRLFHGFLVLVPLVFLGIDYGRAPIISRHCAITDPPTLRALDSKRVLPLGTYLGHELFVTVDSVSDSKALWYAAAGTTALVIDVGHDDPAAPVIGPLLGSTSRKLATVSPKDVAKLQSIVFGSSPTTGHVETIAPAIPSDQRSAFPVDRLYVLGIQPLGAADEARSKALETALAETMRAAEHDRIRNLVIPAIGIDPGDPATMKVHAFYPVVLNSLKASRHPSRIYCLLYQGWSPNSERAALVALQQAWTDLCASAAKSDVFYNQHRRLFLTGCFVCLAFCSLFIEITLKNFLIIASGYIVGVVASLATLDTFVADWNAASRLLVEVAAATVIAFIFPGLSSWNPKEIFK